MCQIQWNFHGKHVWSANLNNKVGHIVGVFDIEGVSSFEVDYLSNSVTQHLDVFSSLEEAKNCVEKVLND